jgi:ribosomal protein S18 acetylase RimI-like enzyme
MIGYQIRPATPHDFPIVIHFVHAMLSEMYALSNHALSAAHTEAWLDFESRILQTLNRAENGKQSCPCAADHLLEIAETMNGDTSPVGLIEASSLRPAPIFRPVQTLYIHALYVLPHYRQRGIGTALLRAAIAWGQQRGCGLAQLSVLPHNPARRLYQELGFTVHGLEMRKEMTSVS